MDIEDAIIEMKRGKIVRRMLGGDIPRCFRIVNGNLEYGYIQGIGEDRKLMWFDRGEFMLSDAEAKDYEIYEEGGLWALRVGCVRYLVIRFEGSFFMPLLRAGISQIVIVVARAWSFE